MNPIITGASTVVAIGSIGGGALYLNELHVASEEFDRYIKSQETRYVLELKREIRQVRQALTSHPDDDYLNDRIMELIEGLCEIRPEDKLCQS